MHELSVDFLMGSRELVDLHELKCCLTYRHIPKANFVSLIFPMATHASRSYSAGGKVRRLAVDATLRAAAPYQKSRRARAAAEGKTLRRVYVEKGDMRR